MGKAARGATLRCAARGTVEGGYPVRGNGHGGDGHPRVAADRGGGAGGTLWQHTNCGHVAGISGCVDRDTFGGPRLHELTIGHQKRLLSKRR